ncbi:TPA_asm: hypothetical protein [Powellomyces chytrid fungus MELD virus 6]|nr:TPA_asm: hypothetical protein [Powellomyces chytrid fungus MELD virus 6]
MELYPSDRFFNREVFASIVRPSNNVSETIWCHGGNNRLRSVVVVSEIHLTLYGDVGRQEDRVTPAKVNRILQGKTLSISRLVPATHPGQYIGRGAAISFENLEINPTCRNCESSAYWAICDFIGVARPRCCSQGGGDSVPKVHDRIVTSWNSRVANSVTSLFCKGNLIVHPVFYQVPVLQERNGKDLERFHPPRLDVVDTLLQR